LRSALPRGLALFLGLFSLLNVLGGFRSARFDASLWWIDLRSLPQALAAPLLLISAICLVAFALWPPASAWRRRLTIACVSALGLAAAANTVNFYVLLLRKTIVAAIPVPVSLLIAAALVLVLLAAVRPVAPALNLRSLVPVLVVFSGCMVAFPLAQMFCFGKTDYRRPADAALVLGARVYADGRPSDALADRIRTGCQLYHAGLARKLVFSGGPGDGPVHETEAMRRMAIQLGVKPQDILLDTAGVNTQASIKNSGPILSSLGASRVLVVSHFYHLPRIKMTCQRAGLEVYTVPARESRLLGQLPYYMAREVVALWVYYLRPLVGK
jgi:uncharacterized SAM-binding protein YcdF (DUF218 family)